ncbi:unnamed protein product [Rotaria socialis]|uniref:MULE transposase domain-containing protein n=2 Tax=Rotaria socialis TaxID=392032 RepID=A0A821U5E2_9BILA|nr:unnamed protein product [Rotaria socialis]
MPTFTFSTTEKNKPLLICKALLHEDDNHNHPGNPVSTEIRIFEEKIRHRALNSNEATQNVIDYCLTNLSDNAVARLPDFKHVNPFNPATQENDGIERVKRNIQNRRGKNDLPEIPHDKTFNLIPDKLTTTNETEQLLVDGTFKVTPSIFYQLYAVHVVYRNAVLPVVFALLPNKTQQTYRRLIDKLSEICPLWSP